ncbi:hypothetical protein D9M68_947470 [compost metagenome]
MVGQGTPQLVGLSAIRLDLGKYPFLREIPDNSPGCFYISNKKMVGDQLGIIRSGMVVFGGVLLFSLAARLKPIGKVSKPLFQHFPVLGGIIGRAVQ